MQWSRLKKEAESRFADSLGGRVEVWAAVYRKPAAADGRGWITLDGAQLWSMADQPGDAARDALSVAVRAADAGGSAGDLARHEAWYFTHREFREALECFLQRTVDELLASPLPLERALARLDRRLGKRRFLRLSVEREHPLVRLLHALRAEAEGWPVLASPSQLPEAPP